MSATKVWRATAVAYGLVLGLSACGPSESVQMNFSETQLTHAAYGHTIHHTQVFSKDG